MLKKINLKFKLSYKIFLNFLKYSNPFNLLTSLIYSFETPSNILHAVDSNIGN
jgi:hypothetical protein